MKMDEEEIKRELAGLSPIERRELFSRKYPQLRLVLQEVTRLERDIFIVKGVLENLEESKVNLEATLLRFALNTEKTKPTETREDADDHESQTSSQ